MSILNRSANHAIVISQAGVTLRVLQIIGNRVRIVVDAPHHIEIKRSQCLPLPPDMVVDRQLGENEIKTGGPDEDHDYMPSPEEIALACRALQSKWTSAERQRRVLGLIPQPKTGPRRIHRRLEPIAQVPTVKKKAAKSSAEAMPPASRDGKS